MINKKYSAGCDEDEGMDLTNPNSEEVFTIDNNIYFYGVIYQTNTIKFVKEFNNLKQNILILNTKYNTKLPINVRINSFGGDVYDSLLMYDLIIEAQKDVVVNTYVDGSCHSGASIVAMAGEKRYMYKNSFMLIHQIRGAVSGKHADIQDNQKNWDNAMNMITDIYLNKSTITKEKLDDLIKRELMLTSQECIELGLVNEII